MSFVNFASRQVQLKIVYYGPGMCGKTTNLQTIHRMIGTDARGNLTSVATAGDRTLFFDFMPLVAEAIDGFTTKFQIYTVPGQAIYNMTRRLVLRGSDGIVFVADSQWTKMQENILSFENLVENLQLQGDSLEKIPYVIQYNKRDLPQVMPVHYMEYVLNRRQTRIPSFEGVATTGGGVFETLNMVARMVLNRFVKMYNRKDVKDQALVLV